MVEDFRLLLLNKQDYSAILPHPLKSVMSDYKTLEKDVTPDRSINAKNLHSPLPLLRLKKELADMDTDEILRIDCTDSGSSNDIANWCSRMNHTYLGEKRESDYSSFFIQK
jgi:tRNA 2-thiouridine synthesizing protein A